MKPFTAELPNIGSRTVEPFRTKNAPEILEALKAVEPPFDADVEAELIALAFVHEDAKVRKKAMALVKKHVADAADFKKAYKSMAGSSQHIVDERVRAFDHPHRLAISRAMLFHRMMAASVAFEQDAQVRAAILEVMVDKAKREKENMLMVGKVYWYWRNSSGWATNIDLHELPRGFFAELTKLRKRYAFDGVSFHGSSLTTLPDDIVKAKSWLKHLSLDWNPFTTLPDVVFELSNLESLQIIGTEMTDIPEGIAKLKKLRFLDIGNGKKMKEIPASVCALDKLEKLRIGNGSIRKIPKAIGGMKSLQVLEMQSTQVRSLPESMSELKALKKIVIRWSDRLDKEKVKLIVPKGVKIEV